MPVQKSLESYWRYHVYFDFFSEMPGSVLPILEIDGKVQIPQSMAIARYLAREFGKYYNLFSDYYEIF